MTLDEVHKTVLPATFSLLPKVMDSPKARTLLLAIGLQESGFRHRRQMNNGPARGYWQFEQGTQQSRGGCWGVFMHRSTALTLHDLCRHRDVPCAPREIHAAIEFDDVFAAGCARLLLLTDPHPLPEVDDPEDAWDYYLRTWRPGKPRPDEWAGNHALAKACVFPPPKLEALD